MKNHWLVASIFDCFATDLLMAWQAIVSGWQCSPCFNWGILVVFLSDSIYRCFWRKFYVRLRLIRDTLATSLMIGLLFYLLLFAFVGDTFGSLKKRRK